MPALAPVAAAPAAEPTARPDLLDRCRAWTVTAEMRAAGVYPYCRPAQGGPEPISAVEGRPVVMFGANNYLGLATDPRLVRASTEAMLEYGVGTTGSRILNGTLDLHLRLEAGLARFHRRDGAVAFSVGYLANLGAISALCGPGDLVLLDRAAHASLVDGCRLAGARVQRFRHNDVDHLVRLLRASPGRPALVAVDGVYSMDGDLAPLPALLEACRDHGARLLVDDAHGIGVLGAGGRGSAEHFGLEHEVDVLVGTFSKSFGTVGGYLVADAAVIEYVRHVARPFMFTASLPAPLAAATLESLAIMEGEPERRARLWRNTARLTAGLRAAGFDVGRTESPIIPIQTGDQARTFALWQGLVRLGVYVSPVLPPAVAPGRCILRAALMATHSPEQVDRLVAALTEVAAELDA